MPNVKISALALLGLAAAASMTPAKADSTIVELRDTEGLANGYFPTNTLTDCHVPNCVIRKDGSLDHQKSYEATERPQAR